MWTAPRSSCVSIRTRCADIRRRMFADPNSPTSFPENYPGEAFWWAGESVIADGLTEKVVLVMVAEAACFR